MPYTSSIPDTPITMPVACDRGIKGLDDVMACKYESYSTTGNTFLSLTYKCNMLPVVNEC